MCLTGGFAPNKLCVGNTKLVHLLDAANSVVALALMATKHALSHEGVSRT